ncbi:NfeD family protein [Rubrobacter aplysinae]|uniref:NfeD family protein n=1 Tax=Rubrobacter aplysinae TaxID=909625 RepID=UPI00069E681A|nr:NfeD family protein [Rubrobacter aplysinae]
MKYATARPGGRPARAGISAILGGFLAALILYSLALAFGVTDEAYAQDGGADEVYVADISQTTGRGDQLTGDSVDYLERVISDAQDADAAVAVELNTLGGRVDLTEEMVNAMSGAEDTPVFVYVPPNARAVSAGTFLLMASDVAAMGPQSRTGSATPIRSTGADITGDLGKKTTNDAVSLITGLASAHDRNEEWAEKAVREAASVNSEEALDMNIVEYVEPGLRGVLEAADGETVEPKGITLDTADAEIVQQSLTFSERFGFSKWFVIVPGVLGVLGLVGTVYAAVRSSRQKVTVGTESMIGEIGDVRSPVAPGSPGIVFVHGERWKAFTESKDSPPLQVGAEAEIVEFRRGGIAVRGSDESASG